MNDKNENNKEIAMEVYYEADGCADGELVYDNAVCPNCGRRFEVDNEEHYNYCPTCGQRLDWVSAKIVKLSDEEKVILKNIDKRFKWIARDKNGNLFIYCSEPFKSKVMWIPQKHADLTDISCFEHLFQFIKWKDEEPYLIEYLLKM